jgi:predicted kinase
MTGLARTTVQEPDFATGASASFGDARRAAYTLEARTVGLNPEGRLEREIQSDTVRAVMAASGIYDPETLDPRFSEDLMQELADSSFLTTPETRNRVREEMVELGLEVPQELDEDWIAQRRESVMTEVRAEREQARAVLSRASQGERLFGGLVGGVQAGFTDPVNLATLPLAAPMRVGALGRIGFEAALNASIEAGQTGTRNRFLEAVGEEGESVLENAAMGAIFGGAFQSAFEVIGAGARGLARMRNLPLPDITRFLNAPAVDRFLTAATRSSRPEERELGRLAIQDREDATAVGVRDDRENEDHITRAQQAFDVATEGSDLAISDRPVIDGGAPVAARTGDVEMVSPGDLLVQPEVFQFRQADVTDPATGTTDLLRGVTEWVPERAGAIIVFEYEGGARAVADGHQRTALATRIAAETGEDIRLPAFVFRESDGYTPEDIRVAAAMANIAQAGRGMTNAMAVDAARVLRIRPEAINQLPSGPGIARARNLSALSDDAFGMVINGRVPENYAELVGELIDDPRIHAQVLQLLERTRPENRTQAEAIVRQAAEAPVVEATQDSLFGPEETAEALFLERARVLDQTLRILRRDRDTFRTLTERQGAIREAGNELNEATNAQVRQTTEQALQVVQRLANRTGPIAEALNNGAQTYRETGRLTDAARRVADVAREALRRDGLSGSGAGAGVTAAEPPPPRAARPDPNEGFSDPENGPAVESQIRDTNFANTGANQSAAPQRFESQEAAIEDLAIRIAAGADRGVIDGHPAVREAVRRMQELEADPTNRRQGYDTDQWHESRRYQIDGETVVGTEAAMPRFIQTAEEFAGPEGPTRNRQATIILGPPAAGKSDIAELLAERQRMAIVDSDEIKKTLPEYQEGIGASAVHEESGDLMADMMDRMMQDGTDMMVPKVGGNPDSIRRLIADLQQNGYTVSVVGMDVTPENAYSRMVARFVATGRIIPPSYMDRIGDNPTLTYSALRDAGDADGFAMIDNNGERFGPKPITDRAGEIDPLRGASDGDAFEGRTPEPGDGGADQRPPDGAGEATDAFERGTVNADLYDQVPLAQAMDEDGNMVAVTRSRAELEAEMAAEESALDVMETCIR